jgi:hypothetical protein
LKQY